MCQVYAMHMKILSKCVVDNMSYKYLNEYEDLIKEWNWEKNNSSGLDPTLLSGGTSKKAWWRCQYGHEWSCRIVDRVSKGSGCPICSNKKILVGFNDLATVAPQLAQEWHPTKNEELCPEHFSCGSNHKVWWRCPLGHEWKAGISERYSGTGCPYCSGKKVLAGFNDLATTNPELAAEWHSTKNGELRPTMFREGSSQKVWWLGACGHEWQAIIGNRKNGSGCPICARKIAAIKNATPEKGINDLLSVFPALSVEWHPTKNRGLKPSDVTANSHQIVWWLGKCGHEWQAHISNRNRGDGCPICNQERGTSFPEKAIFYYLDKIFNDVIGSYHEDWLGSRELDIYIPSLKLAIEYDGKAWHQDRKKDLEKNFLCQKHGITLIRIREMTCPILNSTSIDFQLDNVRTDYSHLDKAINWLLNYLEKTFDKPIPADLVINVEKDVVNINDLIERTQKDVSLFTTNSILAKEWHPTKNGRLTPKNVTAFSNRKVWWLGECGHEWLAGIADRNYGRGCPICSGRRVLKGFNDLETIVPELASEWHPFKNGDLLPSMVTVGSKQNVWWLGKCGHEWQATIDRRSRGAGCKICGVIEASKKKYTPIIGKTDLYTINPQLATEWHPFKNAPLTPQSINANTNRKMWWLGKCGHEWQASVANRNTNAVGCPICSGRLVLRGYNDLETVKPEIAKEWHPIKNGNERPNMYLPQSNQKVWWLGKCGHEWKTSIAGRTNGAGCPICSGNITLAGFNDLRTLNPTLSEEWHPTKNNECSPSMITPNSNRKVWWLGKCGHEWEATVCKRNQGRGCPICSGKKVQSGVNDLQTINPMLADEWHPSKNGDLLPTEVTSGSSKTVWWKCKNGHEWTATINDRNRGSACPICKKNRMKVINK